MNENLEIISSASSEEAYAWVQNKTCEDAMILLNLKTQEPLAGLRRIR